MDHYIEIVEVDSDRGPIYCECWEYPKGFYLAGQYAGTMEGPHAMPKAIAVAVEAGYDRIVVKPLPAWCGGVNPTDKPAIYPEGVLR